PRPVSRVAWRANATMSGETRQDGAKTRHAAAQRRPWPFKLVAFSCGEPLHTSPKNVPAKTMRRAPIPARAAQFERKACGLLFAADEAGDLPVAAFLAVADHVIAERAERVGRHIADLAGGRDDLDHRIVALRFRAVVHDADEVHAELLDHRRIGLGRL